MARGFLSDDRRRAPDLFGEPAAGDGEVRRSDLVDIAAEVRRETAAAWLIHDGTREAWIPKSQAQRDGQTFTMPTWLATEKGLI